MTAELTTVTGQLSISHGKWRSKAPNLVAVREPQSDDAPGAGKGDLFIITEIQGDLSNKDGLEQQLAHTIRDSYYLSRGSITASLRRALQAGSDLLYRQNQQNNSALVGGVVALVTTHNEDAFVAQVGPAAFFAVLGDHIRRYPARSTWLDAAQQLTQNEEDPALGRRAVVEPNLHHLRIGPEDKLVLTDSRLARQLPLKELVRAVDQSDVKSAIKNLGNVAGNIADGSAIVLEIIEAKTASIGPLKIAAPPQLSRLWRRKQPKPAEREVKAAQPAGGPAAERQPEPVAEPEAHSSAVFTSTSILQRPLQWLETLTPRPKITTPQPSIPDDEVAYYSPVPADDKPVDKASAQAPADTSFEPAPQQNKTSINLSPLKKIFKGVGIGLFMLVALLGNGLKNIFNLLLPGGGSNAPRQAGAQAHYSQSATAWTLLRNIAIAIPILVVIIVTVSYLQKGRLREAEYQEYVATAQQKFEQAQAVEGTQALGLMTEAEAALGQAEQIKQDQPEIGELRQQMVAEADRIGNVQRLYYLPQLRQYTDPGTNLAGLVVQGLEIYVLDAGNDRIYHHKLDDLGEALLPDDETVVMVNREQVVENITVNELLGMTWMPTGGNRQTSDLVILSSSGLLEFNANWGITTSALAGTELLKRPVAVDSYFGNFYVLDTQANALFRYLPTLDGYSISPENYFPADQPIDLSNAVDLAIDGSVYVLFSDGRVAKYFGGQAVPEFNVTGLVEPLENPVAIFTAPNEELQHLYIADAGNQRIVQLDKDGTFIRQFKPRAGEAVTFANLQDIYVDEIGERIYILDSNNLYLTNIPTAEE